MGGILEIIFHTYLLSLISYYSIQAILGILVFLKVAERWDTDFWHFSQYTSNFFRNRTSGFWQGSWLLRINTTFPRIPWSKVWSCDYVLGNGMSGEGSSESVSRLSLKDNSCLFFDPFFFCNFCSFLLVGPWGVIENEVLSRLEKSESLRPWNSLPVLEPWSLEFLLSQIHCCLVSATVILGFPSLIAKLNSSWWAFPAEGAARAKCPRQENIHNVKRVKEVEGFWEK